MGAFVRNLMARLGETFSPAAMADTVAAWSTNLVFAVLTFLFYWALWRLVRLVMRPLMKRVGVDQTSRSFFETAARLVILTLGAVAALSEIGINTASILASLGVAGLTIGFAARDALSNIISGLFIYWDRPFVIGDLIEVGSHYGKVDRITLRSTRVVTVDGRMLAIPNGEVVNSTVASYTNFPHLRVDVPITVGVNEDLGRVRALLLGIVEGDPEFDARPAPAVVVTALNDYNVELQLRAWLKDERTHISKRLQLRERMFETLRSAGVDLPFETFAIQPLEVRAVS